MNNKDQIKKY